MVKFTNFILKIRNDIKIKALYSYKCLIMYFGISLRIWFRKAREIVVKDRKVL